MTTITDISDSTIRPFVSICTPTFNRRPFIETMFKCFKHQDYPMSRVEWIIIDDGIDKIEDLVEKSNIPQIKYYKYDTKTLKESNVDLIANEYVEILYHTLKSFGLDQIRKVRKYTTLATHDVDRPFLWDSTLGKIKSIGASLLIRRNKEEIKLRAQNIVTGTDPFDTFDLLMDMSESIGEKAYFFFMAGGETEFDNFYQLGQPVVIDLIKRIKKRNHCIGIHPSYNTYNNTEMLFSEIDALKMATGMEVTVSRQHYLRFDASSTWNNLEDANVRWDSTMGYPDEAGFRSGVCYTYPLYDIYNRKQLNLLEKPLIVMDATLLRYEKLQIEQALSRVENLQKEVHRYQGEFVFLWHNSSFNSQEWIGFDEVYKSMYRQF